MTDKITPKQQEILDQMVPLITKVLWWVDPVDVTMDANWTNDLEADFVNFIDLMLDFEKNFHISIPKDKQESINTVGDMVSIIEKAGQMKCKPAQKRVVKKTSANEITVTLTNVSKGTEKPTVLNCGTITDAQKQHFLAAKYKPNMTDDDFHECGFILYYAQSSKGVLPYGMPEKFRPSKRKIGENELVVEMIPLDANKCGSWDLYNCPKYIASGNCTSPFIKKYIGEVLFPDKYGKQR